MRKLIYKLKNKKGFTLVESVVAIAVLSIASIMFATFLSTSYRLTNLTVANEKDYQLLQEAIVQNDFSGLKIEVIGEIDNPDKTQGQPEKIKSNFILTFTDKEKVKIEGKYIIVTNKETKQHFAIFLGDKYLENARS